MGRSQRIAFTTCFQMSLLSSQQTQNSLPPPAFLKYIRKPLPPAPLFPAKIVLSPADSFYLTLKERVRDRRRTTSYLIHTRGNTSPSFLQRFRNSNLHCSKSSQLSERILAFVYLALIYMSNALFHKGIWLVPGNRVNKARALLNSTIPGRGEP